MLAKTVPLHVGDDEAMSDVYLHVGPVKTGSTYLQSILWNSRDALREQGVLLPAARPNEFFLAANDVQGGRFVLVDLPEAEGAWARVAARAGSWPGRVLITCELLGFSEPDHVQRVVSSLAPATLHLIVMARCRADMLPSVYQETVKMVDPDRSWEDFLRAYRSSHGTWRHSPGTILGRWLPHVPPRRSMWSRSPGAPPTPVSSGGASHGLSASTTPGSAPRTRPRPTPHWTPSMWSCCVP